MTGTRDFIAASLFISCLTLSLTSLAQPQDDDNTPDKPAVALPPDAEHAEATIAKSPRHGEWMDIDLPAVDGKPAAHPLHTYVVYPERKDNAPVVLVIHEIFGMTDWVRAVADQLAAEGFIAVAPDLLSGMAPNGGGTEALGDKATDVIRKLSPAEAADRLDAALEYALKFPSASGKCACIGFCWGGGTSFMYATHQKKLSAAAVYYGTPPSKPDGTIDVAAIANINCPVLGLYGGDDSRITSTVENTKSVMAAKSKKYIVRIFDGAGHGFLRQSDPVARDGKNHEAAQAAWEETISFFKRNLEEAPASSEPADEH
ncbi:MAG TPA: dienelactone hydrolase family protein [Phycisphaerales bacterium]|nr:dienelactone hydrolase family protein [Phycisphaerales bacterium]